MNSYSQKPESDLHKGLAAELLEWFKSSKGYALNDVDLEQYSSKPEIVENKNNVGDGENKQPDIDAYDSSNQVYIRGEAKTGDNDLVSEHSITQFHLFANMFNRNNNKPSLLYIIVPSDKIEKLKNTLSEIGLSDRNNVIPVKSGKYM
jgi:hypothetical protein